jgi:hypothetical protein
MQHTHAAAAAAMMQVGTTSDDPEKSIGHDNVPIPTCRELQYVQQGTAVVGEICMHACSITRCSLWTAGELRRDPPNRATCMPTFFFFGEVVSIDLDPENNNLARPRAATVFDPHSKWMDQTTHKTS